MEKISKSQQKARKKAEEQLRKLLNNEMPPLGVTLTYGADVKGKKTSRSDEERLAKKM